MNFFSIKIKRNAFAKMLCKFKCVNKCCVVDSLEMCHVFFNGKMVMVLMLNLIIHTNYRMTHIILFLILLKVSCLHLSSYMHLNLKKKKFKIII